MHVLNAVVGKELRVSDKLLMSKGSKVGLTLMGVNSNAVIAQARRNYLDALSSAE